MFDVFKSGQLFAYVVTVCDETSAEKCPIFPGPTKRLHWSFPDPSQVTGSKEEKLEQVRAIRDEIRAKIEELVRRSLPGCAAHSASVKKLAAEFFGTFALVFAGTGAIVIDNVSGGAVSHVGVALTFGLIVLAMIYTVGDVSGAHLNPAVTLGFFAARRFKGGDVLPYIISQCLGALGASVVLAIAFPDTMKVLAQPFPPDRPCNPSSSN